VQLRRWAFLAAAAIPCAALLLFFAVGAHEWWLVSSGQIVVIPTPTPGTSSAPETPASRLVPLILGSGILAATFAYAFLRGSRKALIAGYAAIGLLVAVAVVRRML
jgi:hypothetical protein